MKIKPGMVYLKPNLFIIVRHEENSTEIDLPKIYVNSAM